MFIVQVLGLCLLVLLTPITAYYMALALVRLVGGRADRRRGVDATHTFAIVIPAHDEEDTISHTLASCAGLDYPKDKYEVFVVADNCSDRTAQVAAERGATCLVRTDPGRRGKGYALEWAFGRILPAGHDVLVVIDADCRLDGHALRVFDGCLEEGDQVLQANDIASNPDDGAISYAAAVANTIENELFYEPKSRLGLAVFLRGTGMVLRREILERFPWQARSIAEDAEYTLSLLRGGIRVRFIGNVRVVSDFPVRRDQLRIQRTRWIGGSLAFARTHAVRMIWEGLVGRRGLLIDGGWTMLVLVRSLVLLGLISVLALGALCAWRAPGTLSSILVWTGLGLALMQAIYLGMGITLLGLNGRRARFLLSIPIVATRMVAIALAGIIGVDQGLWAMMPRTEADRGADGREGDLSGLQSGADRVGSVIE